MMTRTQKSLVAFELLSGLFGWVWIGCGLGVLLSIIGAVFWQWSWWNVAIFVGVGTIAKWLARGFLVHKQRVRFEANLVASGMSEKEAAEAWNEAYFRGANK